MRRLLATTLALSLAAIAPTHAAPVGPEFGGKKPETVTLQTAEQQPFGAYLTDEKGHAVYVFSKDEKGRSNCGEQCLEAWPPVISAGDAKAGKTVEQNKIGAIDQRGGRQVTYNGRPLYYYKQDGETKATTGQAVFSYDGDWFLIAPNGEPIKTKRPGETPAPNAR